VAAVRAVFACRSCSTFRSTPRVILRVLQPIPGGSRLPGPDVGAFSGRGCARLAPWSGPTRRGQRAPAGRGREPEGWIPGSPTGVQELPNLRGRRRRGNRPGLRAAVRGENLSEYLSAAARGLVEQLPLRGHQPVPGRRRVQNGAQHVGRTRLGQEPEVGSSSTKRIFSVTRRLSVESCGSGFPPSGGAARQGRAFRGKPRPRGCPRRGPESPRPRGPP
jgi:hypothetical protein